jgi:GNAT superfamily N-acetyltransferase
LQEFDCGDEPYEQEVTSWIREWIWKDSARYQSYRDQTVVVADLSENRIVGYGTWECVEAFGTEPVTKHLEIAWFGIDKAYQGASDPEGRRVSDLVYASVEQRAIVDLGVGQDIPLTLTCHVDNFRGRRFWERQGYRLVGPPYAEVEKDRYHRMVR